MPQSNRKKWLLVFLSSCILTATAVLEYINYAGALYSIGYAVAILLAAASERRRYTYLVIGISAVAIWAPLVFHPGPLSEAYLYSRFYASGGVFLIAWLVFRPFWQESRANADRALMEGVFSYGTQSILLIDEDGCICLVNPFAEKVFHYPEGGMNGKRIEELTPEITLAQLISGLSGAAPNRFDSIAKRSDGSEFSIEMTVNPFRSGSKSYFVAFVVDITHRIAQEEALRVQKKSLEEVNAELEAFSYSVSHDLRAPLRAVSGFARMLEEDSGDSLDDEGKRLLKVIQASAGKMGLLIDELLQFSRLGKKALIETRVDMTAAAENALFELAKSAPHSAKITVQPLHPALADASLVVHIWANLISNAIKYSSKVANPTITIRSEEDSAGRIVYSVQDNGVGFDMRYYHKLFGVFQRLHSAEEFEGTGVGLATAQRIIEKHGGRIWAEGAIGEGARFYFTLQG